MCITRSKRNIKQLGFYSNTHLNFLEQKKKKKNFKSEKKNYPRVTIIYQVPSSLL